VGRSYAGVLGTIAFTTVLLRGMASGAVVETTLASAVISLVVFTLLGYFVGRLAGRIVLDSVRASMAAESVAAGAHAVDFTQTDTSYSH
jgi:hypothetical protein